MAWPDRKKVLVGVDFSDASIAALREAQAMVAAPADVCALYVLPNLETEAEFLHAAFNQDQRIAAAAESLRKAVDVVDPGVETRIRVGDPGEEIAEAAREMDCDLIVIPSHGRKGVARWFLGSVAERVLRRSSSPVLVLCREDD